MKKRILLITNGYPYGESERSFLSEEVARMISNFDLYIMAPENQDELLYPVDGIRRIARYKYPGSFREAGGAAMMLDLLKPVVLGEVFDFVKRNHFANAPGDAKEMLYYRCKVWNLAQQILKLVREEKIDVVYTYWCTPCTMAALEVKKQVPGLKVITRFHGYDLYEERTAWGWQPFRKELTRKADGLLFTGEIGREYYVSHWGTGPVDRTGVFYLGSKSMDLGEQEKSDALRLVSCSNVIPLKRVELIIDGLALLPENVKVIWNHFGEGPERQKLEQRAKEKLGSNVQWTFHGYIPNNELVSHYRRVGMDAFITTSSTEGLPVSLMEAFSAGVPVIGTAVGGIPEMVLDRKTGYLMSANPTAEEVAGAIAAFAALDPEERREVSASARKMWQEKFDAEANACRFVEYLKELVGN